MFGLPTFEGRLGRLLSVAVVGLTVGTAGPASAADLKEDPRTMITRDRIESPQH